MYSMVTRTSQLLLLISLTKKTIFCWDLEKVGHQGASHSGLSTKNGDILTIDVKNNGLGATGDYCLVYLMYENRSSLRDGSVDMFLIDKWTR